MKKSAGNMFVKSFMKSFIIMIVLICIGMVSYRLVMHFLNLPVTETAEAFKEQAAENITEASIDDISKNLIFCVDDKTGDITNVLLEIFQCKNKKLYYITIPVRTQFTMTNTLYRRLVPVNPEIPQIIKLSGITKYFDKKSVYDYGVLLTEDLLRIKISYYTVIPESIYDTMFTSEDRENATEALSDQEVSEQITSKRLMPREVFTKEYSDFLRNLKTMDDISKYIDDLYPSIQSNLSLNGKMNYLESYYSTPRSNVYFELLNGENQNSAYIIDSDMVLRQLAACIQD